MQDRAPTHAILVTHSGRHQKMLCLMHILQRSPCARPSIWTTHFLPRRDAALPDFQIDVEFADGTRRRFDYSELIHADDAGVLVAFRDMDVFNAVYIDHGAVTWPGEIDVAPDAMYGRLKASPPNAIV